MNRKVLLVSCLIFMMFISVGIVSAEDINSTSLTVDSTYDNQDYIDENLASSNQDVIGEVISDDIETVDSGTVSGGVDVVTKHPWAESDAKNGNHGDLVYNVPSKATDIKCAYAYVSIYSGSAQSNYGSVADISIKTKNGNLHKTENLWISSGTTDGEIYIVNDHITKCYSDYMIFYNVTNLVQGSAGSSITIDVSSLPMDGKAFDGRIKLISLILAYDDGDSDSIDYWINAGQAWTNEKTYIYFNSGDVDVDSNTKITLTNVGLSSNDAFYEINGESLFVDEDSGDEYINGAYYQYHKWDVTDYFTGDTEIAFTSSKDGWASFKEVLSVLIIDHNFSEDAESNNQTIVDFKTEYSTGVEPTICIFAGTNNTVNIKAMTNNKGSYTIELLADGAVVNKTKVTLLKNVAKTVYLTDPTIRAVNKNTVYGANNKKVNYEVRFLSNNKVINSSSHIIPILYNGYLGKDLAYPNEGYELSVKETITGDMVIDTKDESSYLERTDLKRTDVWNVKLPKNSNFVKAYIYIPYNYYIPDYSKKIPEDINMFNVKFNGVKVTPIGFYRDQSNMGNYAKYGYGLLVYDVTDSIKTGDNTFILNKKDEYPGVYPSTLIYMYNTTGSTKLKEIYISNGVDLLENNYNLANREVKSDTTINLNSELVENAKLYVFAAGAQKGEGNIAFNKVAKSNVWKGTLYTTDLYTLDVTKSINDVNNISFISTGSTIQALQQIIVLSKNLQTSVSKISTEQDNVVFAGIKNNVNINIKNTRSGKVTVKLFADGKLVNTIQIDLKGKSESLRLVDPTIRQATKNSVYGAKNDKVNYTVKVLLNNKIINITSKSIPVLYNGYLGKDLEYSTEGQDLFFKGTITGDIVVSPKDAHLSIPTLKRTESWDVNLAKTYKFVKAYIYVPYYFFDNSLGIAEGKNMFSTEFNGVKVTPIGFYRDQSNYGTSAKYGYGLLVYDVTKLMKNGDNTFTLNKNKATTTVCPSTLIYLYNSTASQISRDVYISNGADLLSLDEVNGMAQVKSNSVITADLKNLKDAKLYVFAAGAQKNEGNIVFNGNEYANVWNGKVFSSDVYSLNVKDKLKEVNSISFVSTGSEMLALQQILVVVKKTTSKITAAEKNFEPAVKTKKYSIALKNFQNKAISNVQVSIKINGVTYKATTNSNGVATFKLTKLTKVGSYNAVITYNGNANYNKITKKVTITVKPTPKLTAKAATFKAKTKTKKYTITLKNNKNKAMNKAKVTLQVNGKKYSATTNSKGQATFKITKLTKKGTFKATVSYAGTKKINKVSKKVNIKVK